MTGGQTCALPIWNNLHKETTEPPMSTHTLTHTSETHTHTHTCAHSDTHDIHKRAHSRAHSHTRYTYTHMFTHKRRTCTRAQSGGSSVTTSPFREVKGYHYKWLSLTFNYSRAPLIPLQPSPPPFYLKLPSFISHVHKSQ